MRSCFRYRPALIWEDKTVDYLTPLIHLGESEQLRPVCARFHHDPGWADIFACNFKTDDHSMSLCEIPHDRKKLHDHTGARLDLTVSGQRSKSLPQISSQQTWPGLDTVSVMVMGQRKPLLSMVACPSGHVTHSFLACDLSISCWAEGSVTFSLHPESWALPTSQSCPVPQNMTSLSPSFPCRSDERRVPYSLVCDHRRDCLDGSDETFCKLIPCDWKSQFQCLNKQVFCAQPLTCNS